MISIENLSVEFGGFTLLNDISFVLNKNERTALVGKNGAGKSTLLKILAGIQHPTRGRVSYPKEISIGYLPQQMKLNDTFSVKEEAAQAFKHLQEMENELEKLHRRLAERTDYESEDYQRIIQRSADLQELLLMSGINNFEAEIEKTLIGLGFSREDFDRPTKEFSGGWRMRIELAKILLQTPDVLLLDEPTNHLDIESIQWLENFLATHANALMLVSHDRAFLDAVTNRTIEIICGKIYDYKVSYSEYVELHKKRREQQLRAYENQQKQIQKTEEFIERFRYKPTKSNQVQSRIKQLEKIEVIEVDEVDNSHLNLKFPPAPRSGSYPVIMENVTKSYGDHVVFSDVNMTIHRGDKVAFVGKNGEGKSTLVKCIMNEIDFQGKLELGHNVKIGYFAQNQAQLLDENLTVFETIDQVATGDIRNKIRDILGAFMFGGEASEKKVKALSGGERSRLAMIRLLLEPVNLLILDEPTNHLDMASKDVLKKAISEFDGTAIIVSHDRDFLNELVTKVYEFGRGKVIEHLGGIYDFLAKKKLENLQQLETSLHSSTLAPVEKKDNRKSENKLSYQEQKEQNKQIKRLEKEIQEIEEKITKMEEKLSSIESELITPEEASNVSLLQSYIDLKNKITITMNIWEQLTLEMEKVQMNMQ
ncbi:ABC-F family ATP-binding cassette domain-containing protein [Anaerorudis cellulosivorans]|uniref:ABC-F family ATP-binding cassette domain-containing protein n=1 Tax=Anaerorudis cellulosivorans TaxID=3397862 RepID=UPI00221F12BE|nr:ABC-F family ATP-binding cassette domain-containing protein [Seramator thermalis]MCW1734411.1 ATP-binding cassette domain-containing protein [Seramator thermalis]